MTDSKHFGNPKVLQFGDKTGSSRSGDGGHCAQCEAMLADALDGTLSAADQALFDTHMAECGPCSQMLADARRGAAFLEMLRTPAPEPPAALLERILAQTSGQAISGIQHAGFSIPAPQPATIGVAAFTPEQAVPPAAYGNLLPFPRRFAAAFRRSSFGQIMLQPRLAMTAAMAFFSIALTMNITGVHLQDLHASDLTPGSLKRDYFSAKARVVQHYEGLRVVYELESRVHDLEAAQDTSTPQSPPVSSSQPNAAPSAQPGPAQQPDQQPARQPGQQKAAPQPGSQPGDDAPGGGGRARKQIAPTPYFSLRDELRQSRRLLVGDDHTAKARKERTLV